LTECLECDGIEEISGPLIIEQLAEHEPALLHRWVFLYFRGKLIVNRFIVILHVCLLLTLIEISGGFIGLIRAIGHHNIIIIFVIIVEASSLWRLAQANLDLKSATISHFH